MVLRVRRDDDPDPDEVDPDKPRRAENHTTDIEGGVGPP
jgi:hypothetical protein